MNLQMRETGSGPSKTSGPVEVPPKRLGGLTGWLAAVLGGLFQVARLRVARRAPRLALLERIALAPRQNLSLVEAEGRRFLVATSVEGTPAFFPLDEKPHSKSRAASAARAS